MSREPSDPDFLPIQVRAYVTRTQEKNREDGEEGEAQLQLPSEWSLGFDWESTTDPSQRGRFGAYQVYKGTVLHEFGFFYADDIPPADLECLRRVVASLPRARLLTVSQFREWVFWKIGYRRRARIFGFNLPFDISRTATGNSPARGETMRGGFSFSLSEGTWWPRVQIKHLSRKAALIQFAQGPRRRDSSSRAKRGLKTPIRRGFFIDVKTLAAAILNELHSLESLCEALKTETRKQRVHSHGEALTPDYVMYCLGDVQATWGCLQKLSALFDEYGLSGVPLSRIYSEASLSKAYQKAMGIRPMLDVQPDVPARLLGQILSTYYGGRTEVRNRRVITRVAHYDFTSMYPSVAVLQKLWGFVIASGFDWAEDTEETRRLLEGVTLTDLRDPAFWPQLTRIVEVSPDYNLLPVRAKYPGESNATIGLNYLKSPTPLFYTIADVILAKILTGKVPQVLRAIAFKPRARQTGLTPIRVAGRQFDPYQEDLLKALIEERQRVKMHAATLTDPEAKARAKRDQQALKLIANTLYGTSVELNVSTLEAKQTVRCHGPSDLSFVVRSNKVEKPGTFFHPLVGTLIAGSARLMLGITEALVAREGLEWVFCDTDSMAIAKPADMEEAEFERRCERVQAWFQAVNPYDFGGSILKREGVNEPLAAADENEGSLYCFAISSKRYVFFNKDVVGAAPIIRKASAHGLGYLLSPYDRKDAPEAIPSPAVDLADLGVARWHYDFWYKILEAALAGTPDRVRRDFHPNLSQPALTRYAVTSPRMLKQFDTYNERVEPAAQVGPFNFMNVLFAKKSGQPQPDLAPRRGRKPKPKEIRAIAPYDEDLRRSIDRAFNRDTGEAVSRDELQSYAEAAALYHLRPESKFRNARAFDRGLTVRRHVIATEIVHIGKETDQLEERVFEVSDGDEELIYGADPATDPLRERLCEAVKRSSLKHVAEATGISRGHVTRVVKGAALNTAVDRDRVLNALRRMNAGESHGSKR